MAATYRPDADVCVWVCVCMNICMRMYIYIYMCIESERDMYMVRGRAPFAESLILEGYNTSHMSSSYVVLHAEAIHVKKLNQTDSP